MRIFKEEAALGKSKCADSIHVDSRWLPLPAASKAATRHIWTTELWQCDNNVAAPGSICSWSASLLVGCWHFHIQSLAFEKKRLSLNLLVDGIWVNELWAHRFRDHFSGNLFKSQINFLNVKTFISHQAFPPFEQQVPGALKVLWLSKTTQRPWRNDSGLIEYISDYRLYALFSKAWSVSHVSQLLIAHQSGSLPYGCIQPGSPVGWDIVY